MYLKTLLVVFVLIFLSPAEIFAQQLTVPRNIEKAFHKLTRSVDGKPGKNYWQNAADYKLHVNFSPATRIVLGSEEVNYINNSPDTLKQIWFKLYPNLYKSGTPRESKLSPEDLGDGLVIDSMWMNGQFVDRSRLKVDGTNMVLDRQFLASGQNISFRIVYHYTLNKGSHVRTGEVEPGADFIAYFFPRVAVYDDIDGWNRNPYNGSQEFYNDFSNFDAYITVPKNFLVWATGDLQNCDEVLNQPYCKRLKEAETSNGITTIIDSTDDPGNITKDEAFNTWHYKAENVTDFVFATSDHYLWKSTSLIVDSVTKRRTRVDAVFNKKHSDYFEVINDARKTVKAMSYAFPAWPFPYPHETVFDGLDQMEYPMMVNDNPVEDRAESIELTDHEIFHTMFPFYMGINETKYGWMDEGWATIGEWLISPMIDSTIIDEYGVGPYEKEAGNEIDLPVTTLTTELTGPAMFLNSYPKPAFGYLYIKDMLGDSLFTKAIHYYIRQWHGRHPMPYDFFNCMNAGSGKNMNWFWKRWFFEGGYPDQAITSVKKKRSGYIILISAKGTKPMPVDLTITFTDNSTSKIHRNVGVWETGNKNISIPVNSGKEIQKVVLGSTYIPDVEKDDNIFQLK